MCHNINVPVVLYGSENWCLSVSEEHRGTVFENREIRRICGPKRKGFRENSIIQITDFLFFAKYYWSRGSPVCVVARLQMSMPRFDFRSGQKVLSQRSGQLRDPPGLLYSGYRNGFPRDKTAEA
jgi:hypothetical protein